MAFKLNPLVATLATVLALTAASASAVTLRVGNQGDALSMDPHSLNESLQISVVENVYETLVSRDANYKLTPLLATSWKQTAPTVWRFGLRKGVKPIRQARPEYPRRALQDEIEGDVLARAQVGRDGRVMSVTIVSARPRGVFERAVEQALRQYEFPPDDTEYVVEVPFSFRLE